MSDKRLKKILEHLRFPGAIVFYENFLMQLDGLVQKPVTVMNMSGNMELNGILGPYDELHEQWCLLLPSGGGRLYFELANIDSIEDNEITVY